MAATALSASRTKDARQKKIVIGGVAVLAIVLVIQVPRLMKQINSGSETTSTPAPLVPATPTPGTPAPTSPVATTPMGVATDKLVSFESFSSKDPFIQQVTPGGGVASGSSASGSGSGASGSGGATVAVEPAGGSLAAAAGFTTSGTPTKPPAAAQTASASIMVNGQVQSIDEGKTFPRNDPVFTLVSVSGSSIEIAIADGSLKGGGKTITVTSGKPVTLKNTADGKRYRIELISTTTS